MNLIFIDIHIIIIKHLSDFKKIQYLISTGLIKNSSFEKFGKYIGNIYNKRYNNIKSYFCNEIIQIMGGIYKMVTDYSEILWSDKYLGSTDFIECHRIPYNDKYNKICWGIDRYNRGFIVLWAKLKDNDIFSANVFFQRYTNELNTWCCSENIFKTRYASLFLKKGIFNIDYIYLRENIDLFINSKEKEIELTYLELIKGEKIITKNRVISC